MWQVHVNINRRGDLLCLTFSYKANVDYTSAVKRTMRLLGYEPADYEVEMQICPDDLK